MEKRLRVKRGTELVVSGCRQPQTDKSCSEVNILMSSFIFGKHMIFNVSTFVSLQRRSYEDRGSNEPLAKIRR